MADELKAQAEIRKDITEAGGYAFKLTNRFTIGIPDLGVWLSPFVPCVIEVKDFGIVKDGFDRDIGTTPKQRDVMRRMSEAYDRKHTVAGVVVHARAGAARRLYCFRWDALRGADGAPYVERTRGGRWDVHALLGHLGVSRFTDRLCPQTGRRCEKDICVFKVECGLNVKD